MSQVMQQTETEEAAARHTFVPLVDIWETENAIELEAELPGVSNEHVDVKFEDGTLTILGRVDAVQLDGYRPVHVEYEAGNFERVFQIPDVVNAEDIQASLRNGLLHVTLPKREALKPKRIDVKVA